VNILPDSKCDWLKSTKHIYEDIRKKYKKILIIHVVIEFCNNFIDIHPNNNDLYYIHEYFIPHDNDIIIKRSRASAFFNTNLNTILRSNNIKNIILCGVSTSGVVLSTLRSASDRDYKIIVIKEAVKKINRKIFSITK
jgi:nicotinamidase-related amidase